MKYTRPMSKLERLIQRWRAKLYNAFDRYDLEALVGASLWGVLLVWLLWLMVFQG